LRRKLRRVELRLCTRIRECSGSFGLLVTFAAGARVRSSVCPSNRSSVHPSVRSSVCLSVCLSVRTSVRSFIRSFVRCLLQRTSDECIAVWPRPEGSLTDYHLVFMVFEVLLNHLAASLLRVRLPSFPPLDPERSLSPSPSPPLAPTRRTRGPKGRKSARRGKVRTNDEDSGPSEAGVNNIVHGTREYTFAQCESLMHRRVGTRMSYMRSYPAVSLSFRHQRHECHCVAVMNED